MRLAEVEHPVIENQVNLPGIILIADSRMAEVRIDFTSGGAGQQTQAYAIGLGAICVGKAT